MHQRNPLINATQRRQSKQQAASSKQAPVGRSRALSVTPNGALYWLPIHQGRRLWGCLALRFAETLKDPPRDQIGLSPRLPMFFAEPHLPRGPVRGVLDHTMAPPNCTAASQSKPPRLSNGSPMGLRSLSFSLCLSLPPRMCVRAYVRASMYVCSACKPTASTAHSCICCVELPAADAQFYIHFCLTCCSPISGCVHMPNSPLIRTVVRYRP